MAVAELTSEEADASIAAVYRDWWETCATIRGRMKLEDGSERIQLTTAPDLRMNDLQSQIDEAVSWCELNKVPCRIIVLKPRKEGATTALVGKSYHLLRSTEAHLLQIGDQLQTTQTMWDMMRVYGEHDGFDQWPGKQKSMSMSAKAGAQAEWTHGSTAWTETAGDKRAGQSKTPTIIHAEEVAHWGRDGAAANASDTMLALLNAVPDISDTYVFVSSTANGTGNWYYRTYQGAVSIQDRMAGRRGNGWIKIFMPWHRSQWSRMHLTPEQQEEVLSSLTDAEKRGMRLWDWRPEQIAWRREQIASKCDGDEGKFAQEQPPDELECFLTSGRPVFSLTGMTRLELMAKIDPGEKPKGEVGQLIFSGIGLTFMPDPDAWLRVWEPPTVGYSYVGTLDTCRHEQAEGSKDPDAHSFWILRPAVKSEEGKILDTRAVARIVHPCQWDADLIADKIALVLKWYGDCMIVPEANQGLDVINALRERECLIYRRPKFDHKNPGKTLEVVGWETTDKTRPLIVSEIQKVVREEALVIECPVAVSQMRTFERNARGKACAKSGCHDDDVIALAIGLFNLSSAKELKPPQPLRMGVPQRRIAGPWG